MKRLLVGAMIGLFLCLVCAPLLDASPRGALSGIVKSDAEGLMEGVLVSAKKVGGTVTVTVATDNTGLYVFPQDRLEPGKYNITTRATDTIHRIPPKS